MTAVSNNYYIDELYDIIDKYNNTHDRTTKMKPINVNSGAYTQYIVDFNASKAKFKVGGHVRISKKKGIFGKDIYS